MTKLYKATFDNYDFNGDGIADKFYVVMKLVKNKTVPVSYSADISGRGRVDGKILAKEFGLENTLLGDVPKGIAFKADTRFGGVFDKMKDDVVLNAFISKNGKNSVRLIAEQSVAINKNSAIVQKLSKLEEEKECIFINPLNLEIVTEARDGESVCRALVRDGTKADNKWRFAHWWKGLNLTGTVEEIK